MTFLMFLIAILPIVSYIVMNGFNSLLFSFDFVDSVMAHTQTLQFLYTVYILVICTVNVN